MNFTSRLRARRAARAGQPAAVLSPPVDGTPTGSLTGSGTTAPTDDFDPGKHTVAEVVAYMEQHPEMVPDVLAAELAGKARKGVLERA